ncbi:MAG: PD40 domain-containing protein, partial [Phycisphaerales bacterium]
IAYVDESTGAERVLYVQDLDRSEARAIPGTEGAINPFFSADGLSLGYADHTRHSLEVVSLGGGVPKNLTEANHSQGAVWLDNGTIIFCPSWQNGLWSVPATGGTAKQLTALNIRKHEICHAWPCALPNNHILFTSFKIREGVWEGQLQVVPSSGGTPHLVLDDAQFGRYIPSGHLIFIRNEALHATCLDTRDFVTQGDAIPLPENVLYNPVCAAAQMCCSSNGRFVFIPAPSSERSLVWVDDHGQSESLRAVSRRYESLSLSPDERYLAVSIETQQRNCDVHSDIWVYDTARSAPTQLTFDGLSTQPRWAVNSRRLIYLKHDRTQDMHDLCAVDVGADKSEEILARVRRLFMLGYSVHPDGNSVIGTVQSPSGDQNIVLVDLRDDSDRERFLVDEAGLQRGPVFSPDGRWFVYSSHETGKWEVYVRPFPGPGQRTPVSKGGGYEPLWDPRGDKLYYRNGDEMWMVSYKADDEFKTAEPKFLFKRHFHGGVLAAERTYAVGRDGRFLMIEEDHAVGTQINIVVNRFEELKQLLPLEQK